MHRLETSCMSIDPKNQVSHNRGASTAFKRDYLLFSPARFVMTWIPVQPAHLFCWHLAPTSLPMAELLAQADTDAQSSTTHLVIRREAR